MFLVALVLFDEDLFQPSCLLFCHQYIPGSGDREPRGTPRHSRRTLGFPCLGDLPISLGYSSLSPPLSSVLFLSRHRELRCPGRRHPPLRSGEDRMHSRARPFVRAGSSQPGLGWCRANTPPEVNRNCSASANAETAICEDCLYRAHARFCNFERSSLPV